MIQGTGSNVGKSLITAGLCRAAVRRGLRVAPFKPQNMSNNAMVTPDCGEIGRAQALQARASGLEPDRRMNPVLLKPEAGQKAQLVLLGKAEGRYSAREYHALKPQILTTAVAAYHSLAAEYDLILVEGAGSPAEVNLRTGDLANMGFAEAVDLPVLLVADIHRGGVIASLIGTHLLLEPSERARLVGYLINQFRGDPGLFTEALGVIADHTGLGCLGIVPFWPKAARLPAEDAMELTSRTHATAGARKIIVPQLSRIANFDDLDPLYAEPDVDVVLVPPGQPLPRNADLILLPGSKATISDLAFLRDQGWDIDILAHHRAGGAVMGICGGYQMLGRSLCDPDGLEGDVAEVAGLGLLDQTTTMAPEKRLQTVSAVDSLTGHTVEGYEMHLGVTSGSDSIQPMLCLDGQPHGGRSPDGLVMGCYLHGLFARDGFRAALLDNLGISRRKAGVYRHQIEQTLDGLADHLEAHVDVGDLLRMSGLRN